MDLPVEQHRHATGHPAQPGDAALLALLRNKSLLLMGDSTDGNLCTHAPWL